MEQFADDIKEILSTVNRETVSAKQVRQLLEQKRNVNLHDVKKELNAVILKCYEDTTKLPIPPFVDRDAVEEKKPEPASPVAEPKKQRRKRATKADSEAENAEAGSAAPGEDADGTPVKKTRTRRKKGDDGEKVDKRRKRNQDPANNPLNKPMKLKEPLAEFLGVQELSRPQTVKKIWEYIKAHDLQDPADKRTIICDEKMKKVFDVDRLHMFAMNKHLTSLFEKADPAAAAAAAAETAPAADAESDKSPAEPAAAAVKETSVSAE
ncbi:RNA polymerase I upstream activation factor complex subunit Spp27 [Schizosaccharomyces japonicus yFS275]|uniref:RNA polymerase I upstream activation factor complex subunit Spp27 n=1 Tax=Schizosaccharomyces japonicus (strain yFS275 / FY16936) TaxID=402676 RepID=B6K125_SCHJY|nr:RNA polymerase I upstream activation factor complex subunit Spp27 [Schizosaccharomyces japonicus yFS275]EEB07646.2 RNA polymerase I upstream activation factor complex subunit Spp27 [Schizosaccharomyces japonicus yFS275]